MKVLHAAETVTGGVATVLNSLLADQQTRSREGEIGWLIPDSQSNQISVDGKHGFTFKRSGRNFRSLLSFSMCFTRAILRHNPTAVHLHSSFAGAIGRVIIMILKPRIRVIYCPHSWGFMMKCSQRKIKLYIALEKFLQHWTDKIICVSNFESDHAVSVGILNSKIVVIRNGVEDLDRLSKESSGDAQWVNALFIGRFDYQKGFDILEEASQLLDHSKVSVVAVGAPIKDCWVSSSSRIKITGWLGRDQVASWIARSDVLIVPSRWEGFAMAPLEAMRSGVALLTSDHPSLLEVLGDSAHGKHFESESPADLARILKETDKSEWRRMGAAGRKLYESEFTARMMCDLTWQAYLPYLTAVPSSN